MTTAAHTVNGRQRFDAEWLTFLELQARRRAQENDLRRAKGLPEVTIQIEPEELEQLLKLARKGMPT